MPRLDVLKEISRLRRRLATSSGNATAVGNDRRTNDLRGQRRSASSWQLVLEIIHRSTSRSRCPEESGCSRGRPSEGHRLLLASKSTERLSPNRATSYSHGIIIAWLMNLAPSAAAT